jgi:uncharacterized protein YoxC
MTIDWPVALIILVLIIVVGAIVSGILNHPHDVALKTISEKYTSQYQALSQETRDLQKAMQTDLAEIRAKVESIERMMREVG